MASNDGDAELFPEVSSRDFLEFQFGETSYGMQLEKGTAKTGKFCAVSCYLREVGGVRTVWMAHDFSFLGGSLGCAEGEKLVLGLEKAREEKLPVILECRSGGARMQEGTLSLMQMAKVSVAVDALKRAKVPFVCIMEDPTYGGVSASYAMQADVRIAIDKSRIGFAGPFVILNTIYQGDHARYDEEVPEKFQSAEFVQKHGQIDVIVEDEEELQKVLSDIVTVFSKMGSKFSVNEDIPVDDEEDTRDAYFQNSRGMDRPQCQDIIAQLFTSFVSLHGDGRVGRDACLEGGIALFHGQPCVVMGTFKAHEPVAMKERNFGMPSPHGYRTAYKLFALANRFSLPVFTLVDTCGAFPTFESEAAGQSEAIASNLSLMSGLRVPIITLMVGEGGSGGALAIAMGNRIGMLSQAYYSVITPEGAASILGRYKDEKHKAQQYPLDCKALAAIQKIYAKDLLRLGVIDEVIPEESQGVEDYKTFPNLLRRIDHFFMRSLGELSGLEEHTLVIDRYSHFRKMGRFHIMSASEQRSILERRPPSQPSSRLDRVVDSRRESRTLTFLADVIVNGKHSAFKGLAPSNVGCPVAIHPSEMQIDTENSAKSILDKHGPEVMCDWVRKQKKLLITDTTMRDAHQSLISTRVRTYDLLLGAEEVSSKLKDAFSLEMWGGATFDVAYRFLKESPWERLRLLREKIPNLCFQMLIRGSNAVGYATYPDNVVVQFIKLAAKNGIDIFRIFDCFNDLEQMRICIDAVRAVGKVAEVAICFTGNFLSDKEKIYTLDYYRDLVKRVAEAGAHIICIKDMAGLVRPQMVTPLVEAVRSVTDLPLHYHTHNTSSAALATCLNMAHAGCDIIDCCVASMADTTSQVSMNALVASLEGSPCDTGINYLDLEHLDQLWQSIRTVYSQFESGLKTGSARVYEHQIPGGQYSNLFSQCTSMGINDRWEEVLDMYRDVNALFGDVIKVTPSSKCVGDMALFLVTRNLTCQDVVESGENIEFPESVVNLFRGLLGVPHHGLPAELTRKILKGKPQVKGRPGASLPPVNFEVTRKHMDEKFYGMHATDEDVISHILYPKVYEDYVLWCRRYGAKCAWLPSHSYFYGMTIGEKIDVTIPASCSVSGSDDVFSVTLKRVGAVVDGMRTLVFEVNGTKREAIIKDISKVSQSSTKPLADESDSSQIGSPLPGAVDKVFVTAGAEVKRGERLLVVSAMKMEVDVTAPFDGCVKQLFVEVGDRVVQSTLLIKLTPSVEDSIIERKESLANWG